MAAFATIKQGAETISEGAQRAYESWERNDVSTCLAELDQMSEDAATLRRQIDEMRADLRYNAPVDEK